MRLTRLLILVLLFPCLLHAQKEITYGDRQFESQAYFAALASYHQALPKCRDKQKKARVEFQLAECYRLTNDPDNAKTFYIKCINDGYTDDRAWLYRARMEQQRGEYQRAIDDYTEYKKRVPNDPEADIGIEACNNSIMWIGEQNRWRVENESQINTKYNDFCPAWSDKNHKSIIFSSKRDGQSGHKIDPNTGMLYTDLFQATISRNGKWSTPAAVSGGVNLPMANDGASSLTKSGNKIYFTRCDQKKKKVVACKIYSSTKNGNTWSVPELVTFGLDATTLDSFNFRHPAISANEEVMIFSSDMTGATGGKYSDLWISYYDKKTKTWGKPVNMGKQFNTSEREGFPYIADDGTLYYSSDGMGGMGGLDLFMATKNGDGWSWNTPVNMKNPFNSSGDDFGIIFDGKQQRGYFSSNRKEGKGSDDIWRFYRETCNLTVQGVLMDSVNHVPVNHAFVMITGSDGSSYGVNTDGNGKFSIPLKENVSYVLDVKSDSAFSSAARSYWAFNSKDRIRLSTLDLTDCKSYDALLFVDPIPVKDLYFPAVLYGLDSANLRPQSKDSLNYLYNLLIDNPNLVIEIDAHTDCRGSADHNRDLSQRRAQSCVDYLISKGIDPKRMVAKGWGEDAPVKFHGTVLTEKYINTKKTVQEREALHQLNRRTTFRVIRTDFVDPKNPGRPAPPPVNVKKGEFDESGAEESDPNSGE